MRLTALLLVALVGALACAQDTTTDYIQDATAKDPLSSELEITAPAKSASLQETTTAAQKTSGAAQASARVALREQGLSPLKFVIEKSLLLAEQAFDGAEKRVHERIQDGKQLAEGGQEGMSFSFWWSRLYTKAEEGFFGSKKIVISELAEKNGIWELNALNMCAAQSN